MKRLACTLLLAVFFTCQPAASLELLMYTPETSDLGDEFVNALLLREDGSLILGTDTGVGRFDLQTGFLPVPYTPSVSNISALSSGKPGILWAGTYGNGLFSCTPEGFIQFRRGDYGLVDNFITCLAYDQATRELWAGTKRGLSRFKDGIFTSYTRLEGMPESLIRDVAAQNGSVWVATDSGVVSLESSGRWEPWPAGQDISWATSLAVTEGGVWIGSRDGLFFVSDKGVRPFTLENSGLPHHHVVDVAVRGREVWISTLGGLAVFDGVLWRQVEAGKGVPSPPTGTLMVTPDRTWVSVPGFGLALVVSDETALPFIRPREGKRTYGILQRIRERERGLTRTWFTYGTEDGLPSQKVTTLAPDQHSYDGKQVLWTGTSEGVARFDGMVFETFEDQIPLLYKWETTSIVLDQVPPGSRKHIWIGTRGGGIFAFDGESWTHFGTLEGLPDNVILCMAREGRRLWVGTRRGLCVYDGNSWTTFGRDEGLGGENIYTILITGSGVWMGTDIGVSFFDGRKFRNYTMWDGLPGLRIQALGMFNDVIWFGALRGGLGTFDKNIFREIPSEKLLAGRAVTSFFADSVSLWIATSNGALRYIGDSWKKIGAGQDELPAAEGVNSIFVTEEVAWFATDDGLVRHLIRNP